MTTQGLSIDEVARCSGLRPSTRQHHEQIFSPPAMVQYFKVAGFTRAAVNQLGTGGGVHSGQRLVSFWRQLGHQKLIQWQRMKQLAGWELACNCADMTSYVITKEAVPDAKGVGAR